MYSELCNSNGTSGDCIRLVYYYIIILQNCHSVFYLLPCPLVAVPILDLDEPAVDMTSPYSAPRNTLVENGISSPIPEVIIEDVEFSVNQSSQGTSCAPIRFLDIITSRIKKVIICPGCNSCQ